MLPDAFVIDPYRMPVLRSHVALLQAFKDGAKKTSSGEEAREGQEDPRRACCAGQDEEKSGQEER